MPECDPPCGEGKCVSPNNCAYDVPFIPDSNEISQEIDGNTHRETSLDDFLHELGLVSTTTTERATDPVNIESPANQFYPKPDYVGDYDAEDSEEESDEEELPMAPLTPTTEQYCDDGLVQDSNGLCRTKCEVDCHYGHLENGSCICNEGFNQAPNNPCVCEPFCEHDCLNGICMGNNKCLCEEGFKLNPENKFTCMDSNKCHCINGDCVNPETCNCWQGYELKYNETNYHRCEPICGDSKDPQGCINGKCVAASLCLCDPGFISGPNNNYTCYANLSCHECLAQEEFACLPQCFLTDIQQ